MRAFFLTDIGKTEIRDIDPPLMTDDEVKLRVEMVGICGGDLNGYRGTFALQEYPVVLGHEVGAIVEDVGKNVPGHLKPGMKVTISPYKNCGVCYSCTHGKPNACIDNRTMGVRRPGAMTTYIAVPWQDVYSSDKLTTKEMALVEPLTVGFHAVARGRVLTGDKVAVFGCGIVGMGVVAGAAAAGGEVIAIDIADKKLEDAVKAGATHTINTEKQDLHQTLSDLTNGFGPDVIIEAVGLPSTFLSAVEEVAFTGRVVYIGYAKIPVEYDTKLFVQKELEVFGSRNCLGDFPAVINMLEQGKFPVDHVISKQITMDEAGETIADWDKNPGKYTKIMVDLRNEK
jgi:threonine dehydrogenase-like Zn-dependent dehydrogenase